MSDRLFRKVAHIPLTDAVSTFARKVEVDVVFMIAVRARAKDSCKEPARLVTYREMQAHRGRWISQHQHLSALKDPRPHIDGISAPVLG